MTAIDNPRSRFDQQLALEADRVLSDVAFKRSPMQSQLLSYLVERSLSDLPAPTQYEIAVDGLGKGDDYDLSSDSYPRVQISRLRKNLDNYYARNLPHAGMRIEIDSSSYRLIMTPHEPIRQNTQSGMKTLTEAIKSAEKRAASRGLALVLLGIVAIALTTALVMWDRGGSTETVSAGSQRPLVALTIDTAPTNRSQSETRRIAAIVEQIAGIQLTNSFVSSFVRQDIGSAAPDYLLSVNIGPDGAGGTVALLALTRSDQSLIYSNTIAYDDTQPLAFSGELEASLIYMTSPTGAIASNEMLGISDPSASDYACFLTIEGRRANGETLTLLVDDCLERFPESEFRSFWFARKAFSQYQRAVIENRPLEKEGPAWSNLQRAFDADRYNAFANFVAAKVELANGRCGDAVAYVARALERGGSYPSLIAAIEADAAACLSRSENRVFDVDRVRSLARYNPSPDPLLHLYLMVAAISIEDRAVAEQVARRTVIANPEGPVEVTSDLLRQSIENPQFAKQNQAELKNNIRLFVWNEASIDKILGRLVAG